MICACGKGIGSNGPQVKCNGCGRIHRTFPASELRRAARRKPDTWFAIERRAICGECEHNTGGRCELLVAKGLAGVIESRRGIHRPESYCLDGRFAAVDFDPNLGTGRPQTWITWERMRKDVAEFASRIAAMDVRAIAGVPRSGMVVASEIAVRLGLPLYSFDSNGVSRLSTGLRLRGQQEKPGKLLVIEDSSASGASIIEVRNVVSDPSALFGAVYVTSGGVDNVDIYHRIVDLPHWFEWNLIGNRLMTGEGRIGIDFDGILCSDFTPHDDDDGPRYRKRMAQTPCIRHPGVATPTIITARLERYRSITEHWLDRHHIQYTKLIMGPWSTKEERSHVCIGAWKAGQCKASGVHLFVESDITQATVIAKQVACVCPEA